MQRGNLDLETIGKQCHFIERIDRHKPATLPLFWEYTNMRAAGWPARFTPGQPDIYDKYPSTVFVYLTNSAGQLIAAARILTHTPGSKLPLYFEKKSPYSFNGTNGKPGLAEHLDPEKVSYAELSGVLARPAYRGTGIGTKFNNILFSFAKTLPTPDIFIIGALPRNVGISLIALHNQGFEAIVRTDRNPTGEDGLPITTILASHNGTPLAAPELFKSGAAVKAADYFRQIKTNQGRS